MGLILNEKHYEQIKQDERWYFNLCGWSDPAADYICFITLQRWTDGQWRNTTDEPSHRRHFDRAKLNINHYAKFRKKFARDSEYQKKWENNRDE